MTHKVLQNHNRYALVSVVLAISTMILTCCRLAGPTPISTPSPITQAPITPSPGIKPGTLVAITPSPSPAPTVSPATPTSAPRDQQLAFLKEDDVCLVDVPDGNPIQLTHSGDIAAFAWSPDGERIATSNGHSLRFVEHDGSSTIPCMDLGADSFQSTKRHQIIWSPDQQHIIIWNAVLSDSDGWLIISLAGTSPSLHIVDTAAWGLTMFPPSDLGGYTYQPLFLPDGTLIGTLSHPALCGSGGCPHELYQFDLQMQRFIRHPIGDSEFFKYGYGGGTLVLSADGRVLLNFRRHHKGCAYYTTYVGVFYLDTGNELEFSFVQDAFYELALSPDGSNAIIARGVGCNSENQREWAMDCGLSEYFEIYTMQLWDLQANLRTDLVPGLSIDWALDSSRIAFRSCLAQTQNSQWEPTSSGPPWIFIMEPTGDHSSIVPILDGLSPAWRPSRLP